jgi:8-oxo-dGTP pyrophosphatase MutT (NUDIX family)
MNQPANFNFCPKCGQKNSISTKSATTIACSACDWQFWNNPKASVTTLFVKNGQILVATRGSTDSRQDLNGRLQLTGGFVDYGESAYDAARREAMEELGVTITDFTLLDVWAREYDPDNTPPISVIDCVFVVTKWEGTLVAQDDIAAIEWRPLEVVEDPAQAFEYPGLLKKLKLFLADIKS